MAQQFPSSRVASSENRAYGTSLPANIYRARDPAPLNTLQLWLAASYSPSSHFVFSLDTLSRLPTLVQPLPAPYYSKNALPRRSYRCPRCHRLRRVRARSHRQQLARVERVREVQQRRWPQDRSLPRVSLPAFEANELGSGYLPQQLTFLPSPPASPRPPVFCSTRPTT